MLFHVRLTHSPENCWARDEHEGKPRALVERVEDAEEAFDVRVQGAFVAPNEHTFYFVVEADTFENVSALFGPPLLHDHDADVVPVMQIGDVLAALDLE